jgi:alpha-L-fucosidase 2
MYKIGCVSRPGKLPITLQGLWTLDGGMPPWAGDYHLDMNVQQSYWPIYAANRLELGEPLYRTFSACIPRWREQCKAFFGNDGLWAGCAIGPKGERIYGYSGVELWPGNVAWLAHHYWLHFLYSRDKAFLRDQALPMLELSFLTYANILEKGDDGKLHVPMSYSPEYREGGADAYCKDPNCDLALIRFLARAITEGCGVLGVKDAVLKKAEDVQENLVDYQKDGARLRINDDVKLDHSHRHHSHLMAIHPLGLVTLDGSDEDKAMIRESLHEIRVKGTGEWTGWSFPWMSLLASRGGYGNMAWRMLDTYVDGFITPNTFHINGDPRVHGSSLFEYEPMTLEAGFGAAAAIMEMLLQSYDGCIRLFPTVPDQWHDAYFADLRAEGAFVVTAKFEKGETLFASIKSEAGEPCRVKNVFGGDVELIEPDNPGAAPKTLQGDVLAFDTKPGARYLLHPAGKQLDATAMAPTTFNRTDDETNFFGVKKLARF